MGHAQHIEEVDRLSPGGQFQQAMGQGRIEFGQFAADKIENVVVLEVDGLVGDEKDLARWVDDVDKVGVGPVVQAGPMRIQPGAVEVKCLVQILRPGG